MIQLYDRSKMDDAGDMYALLGWTVQLGEGCPSTGYNRQLFMNVPPIQAVQFVAGKFLRP
jgi:hypothetical protein